MYVYIETERGVYTVGFYTNDGRFNSESDWTTKEDAARRTSYLNGNKEAQQ